MPPEPVEISPPSALRYNILGAVPLDFDIISLSSNSKCCPTVLPIFNAQALLLVPLASVVLDKTKVPVTVPPDNFK